MSRFLNVWHSALLGFQVNREALLYLLSKRIQTIMRAWKQQTSILVNDRLREVKAEKHY